MEMEFLKLINKDKIKFKISNAFLAVGSNEKEKEKKKTKKRNSIEGIPRAFLRYRLFDRRARGF